MPKLKPQKQIKLNNHVVNALLKAYNLTARSFKIFPHGIENTSLLVTTNKGKYVVRVYQKNKKTIKNIEQEIAFMEFLRNGKIPVPQVFENTFGNQVSRYNDSETVWSYILMEFAPGKHPESYSKSAVKNLAATQAKMHKLGSVFAKKIEDPKSFWKHLRERAFSPHIKISTIKDAAVRDFIIRAKKYEAAVPRNLPQGYNHLDMTNVNILTQNNRITAILDFDDACYSPPVVCVGYCLLDVLYITKDVRDISTYLATYKKYRPLTRLELRTLKNIILFRNYVVGAMEVLFHGEKSKYIKSILEFEEIIKNLKEISQ